MARQGKARRGVARSEARRGVARQGKARLGKARNVVRQGKARLGMAGHGKANTATLVVVFFFILFGV